ncbi:hypothetical protein VDG1235_4815 [Verrucomicrobiia bacterium DG1235]|nr:hypothetical protein VDG1235_4815 [Verrucomicrobiae bacterium DG1235]
MGDAKHRDEVLSAANQSLRGCHFGFKWLLSVHSGLEGIEP